jgi:hypothetical protein
MIDRQQRVRLATTECGLQLDDGLTAFAIETLRHLSEQTSHALSNKGAFVESLGIPVFGGRLTGPYRREVGGKLGLLECAI